MCTHDLSEMHMIIFVVLHYMQISSCICGHKCLEMHKRWTFSCNYTIVDPQSLYVCVTMCVIHFKIIQVIIHMTFQM